MVPSVVYEEFNATLPILVRKRDEDLLFDFMTIRDDAISKGGVGTSVVLLLLVERTGKEIPDRLLAIVDELIGALKAYHVQVEDTEQMQLLHLLEQKLSTAVDHLAGQLFNHTSFRQNAFGGIGPGFIEGLSLVFFYGR